MCVFKVDMNSFLPKSVFFMTIAVVLLFGGQWASAGNLPSWGGATTTTTQPQQIQEPIVSQPAANTAPTVQSPSPGTWTAPATTSSPTVSTPLQPRSFQLKPGATSIAPATGTRSTSQPSGSTGTSQQPAPGKKAKYRITLNGFKIFAQKGVLPRRGHSYYIAAKVLKYSQWGAILSHETKVTKVIGHTNKFPGALKGGTATSNGGFRNGDTYPGSIPYAASGAYSDRLPLLVWEGILEEGGDVVVVEPTIWEKRNGQDIFRVWYERIPSQIPDLLKCGTNEFSPNGVGSPVPGWTSQNTTPIDNLLSSEFRFSDKRVCLTITPRDLFRPLGRNTPDAIPGYTENIFPDGPSMTDPHGILFNYSKAAMIAGENQTEPVVLVTYQEPSGEFDYPGGFPKDFVRANQRNSSVLPAGGIQPFWFGSRGNSGSLYTQRIPIRTEQLSESANFFSAGTAHPIIPDTTAIELYLKIQQLPL